MAINISNILTQLNTKMTTDSSASTTELLRRVKAYNDLNNAGRVFEYQSYPDLPTVDSSNIGQLAYVRSSLDDSFGTFFFAKIPSDGHIQLHTGWQKIVLNANDSDNFSNIITKASSGYHFSNATPANGIQVDKFPFASETAVSSVGNLTNIRSADGSTHESPTHAYYSGGGGAGDGSANVDKFSFISPVTFTTVADLVSEVDDHAGTSSSTHGYTVGGKQGPGAANGVNIIQKFPFSTDTTGTDVGDLTVATSVLTGIKSISYQKGYAVGGENTSNTSINVIQSFSTIYDGNATDVGDMTVTRERLGSAFSDTHGYNTGGQTSPTPITKYNVIDKFPFATDANATDVGDLVYDTNGDNGASSTSHGYLVGGSIVGTTLDTTTIQKFPFASDANATEILTSSSFGDTGLETKASQG
jgi:hypothetical protein